MKKIKKNSEKVAFSIVMIILLLIAAIELVPFLWMFMSGFKSNSELLLDPFAFPETWLVNNYQRAWVNGIGKYLLNSIWVTGVSTVLTLVFSILAAYPIARIKFKYSKAALIFVMSGLMLAPMVAMIPLYKILIGTHLYDTYWAMIIPYLKGICGSNCRSKKTSPDPKKIYVEIRVLIF